jgi:hypothetical protein
MSDAVDEWVRDGERRQRRWVFVGTLALVAAMLVIGAIYFAIKGNAIPAGDQRAISAIEANGFSHVLLGGAAVLACAEGESSRRFEATNPAGARVEGAVCCGITGAGKGCTLRFK